MPVVNKETNNESKEMPSGEEIKSAAEGLVDLIKLRTFPFGMKLFEDSDEMLAIKGLRTPSDGKFFTTCQLVTQVRTAGFTLGIMQDNLRPGSVAERILD